MALGWGIVGAGGIAEQYAHAINNVQNAKLAAITEIDEAKAKAFTSKYEVKHVYKSLRSLLKNPEVDIVYIATPNHLHAEQTIMAAEAKKHVLCEKPMALTASDCQAMIKACKSNNVKLGIGFQRRLDPGYQFIGEMIREGKIGDLLLAKTQSAYQLTRPRSQWRTDPELAGGGTMMHQGIHLIDMFNYLFERKIIEISAMIDQERGIVSVGPQDALTTVLMRYEDQIIAILVCSTILPNSVNDFVVFGTTGRIQKLDGDIIIARGGGIWPTRAKSKETLYKIPGDSRRNLVQSFTRNVEEDSEWEGASGFDGLRVVEELQALFESAKNGKTIKVNYSQA